MAPSPVPPPGDAGDDLEAEVSGPLADLRLLQFIYWGFDGAVSRGPMVVHEDVAEDVLWVFRRLFRARFPIKHVTLAREFRPSEWEPRIRAPGA